MSTAAANSSMGGQQRETAVLKRKREAGQLDIWASIQAAAADHAPPYVHPLPRRSSSSSLGQNSLETCTESLGSETGSDSFSDGEDLLLTSPTSDGTDLDKYMKEGPVATDDEDHQMLQEMQVVNYHCSATRSLPPRFFPPPLPSISRRDGRCLQMRHQRKDGRLVVQAVPAPSQNYLNCRREGGRLHLSLVETNFDGIYHDIKELDSDVGEEEQASEAPGSESDQQGEGEDEEGGDDEFGGHDEYEEEVEVVDRGNVVEVKVSSVPQLQGGGMKKHKSSLVINKFVGGTPLDDTVVEDAKPATGSETSGNTEDVPPPPSTPVPDHVLLPTTMQEVMDRWGSGQPSFAGTTQESKLLFTRSKKMTNRQALLHHVRRCSEYYRPLFFFEPWCIATS